MEMVKTSNIDEFEQLTKLRGKLNISKSSPKKFTFGTIIENAEDIMKDTEFTFCVFRVGIGKSYCHKMQQDDSIENIPLKDGYDSVYLENANPSNGKVFQMNYIIYSAENVQLTHVIKTRIDVEDFQARLEPKTCRICQEPAHVYCEMDHEYFCLNCDDRVHEGDETENENDQKSKVLRDMLRDHKRVPIQDAKPQMFGYCQEHPKKENEYYDRVRNKAFCTICAIDMA